MRLKIRNILSIMLGLFLFHGAAFANPVEMRKNSDASAHRGILVPTAETLGQGDLSLTSIELFFFNVSYGLSDNTQLSMTSLIPLFEGQPFFGVISAKQKLLRMPNFQLSVMPNTTIFSDVGVSMVGLQILADYSLDSEGKYIISFSDNNQFVWLGNEGIVGDGFLVGASVGFSGRIKPNFALMVEATVPGYIASGDGQTDIGYADAALATYGFRYTSSSVSGDFSFLRIIGDDDNLTPLGMPFVTLTVKI